jgi:hypothetical protein
VGRIRRQRDINRLLAAAIDAALADEGRRHRRLHGFGALATGAALVTAVQLATGRRIPGIPKLGLTIADMPKLQDIPDALRDRLAEHGLIHEPGPDEDEEPEGYEDEQVDEYDDDEEPDADRDYGEYEDEDEDEDEDPEEEEREDEREPAVAHANGVDPADRPPKHPSGNGEGD